MIIWQRKCTIIIINDYLATRITSAKNLSYPAYPNVTFHNTPSPQHSLS